ncbi:MAG: DUF2125 domain-containing protein [Pseudomonadota bacterium]
MTRFSLLARSTAIALCLPATAAFADLTAADVWADWKSYMSSAGYAVSGSEVSEAGALTINDLTMAMDLSDDTGDGTVSVLLDTVRFVEQGDGTVAIELPEDSGFDMQFEPDTGEKINATIAFTQTAPVMTAAGDPTELTYDYAASAAAIVLSSLTVDGTALNKDIVNIAVTMTGLAYTTQTSVGDNLRSMDQDMSVATLDYDIGFSDPEGDGTAKIAGNIRDLQFDGGGDLPGDADPQDFNAMLNAGFGVAGTFTSAGGSYDMSFSGPDGSGTANSTSQGADITVAMDATGLTYDIVQRDVAANVLITEFPLPLSFSAAELGTSVQMPLQKSPQEQDFGLAVLLSDFTMSDVIWGLFDPAGQLPRDPATLAVDLSGKAKVLFDFLDPAQAAVLEETGAVPGELNALTLNALELDAVGAKLTGSGNFTFDNSDLTTFDGMPRPAGGIDLSLVGGNVLLDKLVGMGLLPEDQAMGARMMMGLFAVPGEGPDTLNSRIEVNDEGHVLANGQRIR